VRAGDRREAGVCAAFVAGALLLFGMTVPAPVFLDDWSFVLKAPFLRLSWPDFRAILLSRDYFAYTGERTWQPLVTLLHWLVRVPAELRLIGILLHAGNALLLRAAARRLGAPEKTATAAAALWLVFPFHSEALFLSSFKGHLLAAASALAALYAWERATGGKTTDRRWLAASWGALVLGLFGKETAVVGPALIGVRVLLGDPKRRVERLRLLAGHAVICAAYLVWRFGILRPAPAFAYPAPRRPLGSLGWYLVALVKPWPSCLARSLRAGWWPAAAVLPYAGAVWAARKRPLALYGLLWIPAALLPFLHFVRFAAYCPVADRYLYLASAGACLALADLLAGTRWRLTLAVVGVAWGALLARRNGEFRDLPAVCAQTAACAPDNPLALELWGEERLTEGDYEAARTALEKAVSISPRDPDILNNLGLARYRTGDKEGARAAFARVVELKPAPGAWNNLALVLLDLGRKKEALEARARAKALLTGRAAPGDPPFVESPP
jgi:hypothetical protein